MLCDIGLVCRSSTQIVKLRFLVKRDPQRVYFAASFLEAEPSFSFLRLLWNRISLPADIICIIKLLLLVVIRLNR